MRRLAMEIVGQLGNTGTEGAVVADLMRIVGDAQEPFDLRLAAASAIGHMKYRGSIAKVNSPAGIIILNSLIYEICKREGLTDDPNYQFNRRRFLRRLAIVDSAIVGISEDSARAGFVASVISNSPLKQSAFAISQNLKSMITLTENRSADDFMVQGQVKTKDLPAIQSHIAKMRQILSPKKAAPAPAPVARPKAPDMPPAPPAN